MRYAQLIGDLTRVMLITISHHARSADDFESGNLRQFGHKIVLNTVSKGGILSVITQILKWKYCDSSCCGSAEQVGFPNDHAYRCYQGERQYGDSGNGWISLQPFLTPAKHSSTPGLNRFVP